MKQVTAHIPGYNYGDPGLGISPISLQELDDLKTSVGFIAEDQRYLQRAGEVLADQTQALIDHWRGHIIASIPNLARHSRTPEGQPIPDYLARSGLRFQQWILDTCFRPYDQDWLNYQHEIALRHTTLKKNQVDSVCSTSHVPLRDIIAFVAVMNETVKPYLASKGDPPEEVEKMHAAWCKSLQLQLSLWARPYTDSSQKTPQW